MEILTRVKNAVLNVPSRFKEEWHNTDRKAFHKLPLSLSCLYALGGLLWYWNAHVPTPGKAVGVLAVAAAVMAVLGEMGGKEKMAWILLLFGLLWVEIHSLDAERKAQELERQEARREELERFKGIGEGITDSIKQSDSHFDATMRSTNKLLGDSADLVRLSKQNIDTVTGGDSYCVATAVPIGSDFLFVAGLRGPNPLREILVEIRDRDTIAGLKQLTFDEIESHTIRYTIPVLSSTGAQMIGRLSIGDVDKRNLNFSFFGTNGVWSQSLKLRKVNSVWIQAYRVSKEIRSRDNKNSQTKILEELVPPTYPKVNGKVDWP